MITFSRTYTRPNTDTLFHHEVLDNTSYKAHLVPNYIESGELISQSKDFSPDGMIMTYNALWVSREAFDRHDVDTVLQEYWTQRDIYCTTNNIILGPQTFANLE
jgi:hypothetical protein